METERSLLHYNELSPAQLRIFRCAAAVTGLLLVPVPWKYDMSSTYGFANRINESLEVNGEIVDPPGDGEWSRLAVVGRPQFLGEVMMAGVFGKADDAKDIREGPETSKPNVGVPAAAQVGLDHAGYSVEELEADIKYSLMPDQKTVSILSEPIVDRVTSVLNYADENQNLGSYHSGGSHGMMIALATYSHASEVNLAQGRHITGTGSIRSDGTVTSINSLVAKAKAAERAGADVMLVPASQEDELSELSLTATEIVGVETLQDAIDWLSVSVEED